MAPKQRSEEVANRALPNQSLWPPSGAPARQAVTVDRKPRSTRTPLSPDRRKGFAVCLPKE
jgi:hypothetical protein